MWYLWERWAGADFSEELDRYLNSGERGRADLDNAKVILSLVPPSVVHEPAASALFGSFLEICNMPRPTEPESTL